MEKQKLPAHAGQICAIQVCIGHIPKEHYILCEQPDPNNMHQSVKVCSITELQRATYKKREPEAEIIPLFNLYVVAESLEVWAKSWNLPGKTA